MRICYHASMTSYFHVLSFQYTHILLKKSVTAEGLTRWLQVTHTLLGWQLNLLLTCEWETSFRRLPDPVQYVLLFHGSSHLYFKFRLKRRIPQWKNTGRQVNGYVPNTPARTGDKRLRKRKFPHMCFIFPLSLFTTFPSPERLQLKGDWLDSKGNPKWVKNTMQWVRIESQISDINCVCVPICGPG